jgi:uncharacterized membrane protein YjgN (DUF898 family)
MNYNNQKPTKSRNADVMRYASLGTQLFVALGLAVFGGIKADAWLKTTFPLLVWILPLLIIVILIYKLIKETSNQKK